MTRPIHQKVTASHLRHDAYLYVRQSTVRQVFENTESTRRQYALRERAVALGWPIERVNVIDSDLGKSGASSAARDGAGKMVEPRGEMARRAATSQSRTGRPAPGNPIGISTSTRPACRSASTTSSKRPTRPWRKTPRSSSAT